MAIALLLTSCTAPQVGQPGAAQDSPSARIQAIPNPNPILYRNMKDMKNWRNPYLIIRSDRVALLDVNNNEERMLKPEEVLKALADLPSSAWPYGRVVALQDQAILNSESDKVALRRIKGIVAGSLEELHVTINWVPSA